MTTAMRPLGAENGTAIKAPLVARPDRRRRWSLALVALLVTVGSALAFVVLWLNAGDRKPVLALAHRVAVGQVISSDDLTTVRISTDPGLKPVSADKRDEIVGKTAAVELAPGSLLTQSQVGAGSGLQAGQAIVSVTMPGAQLPVGDLRPGNQVLLVRTATSTTATSTPVGGGADGNLGQGRVFAVEKVGSGSDAVRVSVVVDEKVAPEVASANANNQVRLALVPGS